MLSAYELTKLDPDTFEHMVNMLALKVIGKGVTGFGPGPDGGRDGYFEGSAPYPSETERWAGTWYIQSKFHRPHLTKNAQDWLTAEVSSEIKEFEKPHSRRQWPDNWIIVSNIDPSGTPETGSFDRCRELVESARQPLADRFHIWGGQKVLHLLNDYPEIGEYYGEFLTPGHVLKTMYNTMGDAQASTNAILRHFVVTQFDEQQHTKLEQAGSPTDNRPGIHQLFTDLPFISPPTGARGFGADQLAKTLAYDHRDPKSETDIQNWQEWQRLPARARTWFIKGGPGQGKSTLTQYICQIQRAALLLQPNGPNSSPAQINVAKQIRESTIVGTLWPLAPRIPVHLELRDFAQWYGQQGSEAAQGILSYLADRLAKSVEQPVLTGTLLRMFGQSKWVFVFDGLDEVPSDIKDSVSKEVIKFTNNLIGYRSDAVIVCTSRPQGYSGQLNALDATMIELSKLSPRQALECARPVLAIDRTKEESASYLKILEQALVSVAVQEIMTTPLQSHIMAVVVRDGSKPPERKWTLFTKFYNVIKQREANHSLVKPALARLLQEEDILLKAIHNRLGFELHKKAETKAGANSFLLKSEFEKIARDTVKGLQDDQIEQTVETLMEATTERLVLVSTPENGTQVRFDIRPLQEFFAAEYVYEAVDSEKFSKRVREIADDSHWREVMHFLLSALVENGRQAELSIAVQILREINGDAADEETRLLKRKMAIGSLITIRLLEEGVLDQDRRVRNKFKECLEPLLVSSEIAHGLVNVRGPHTLSWLKSMLKRQLLERTESENLASCALLALTQTQDQDTENQLVNFISETTVEFRSSFFELLAEERDFDEQLLPDFVVKIALSARLSTDWLAYRPTALEALEMILSRGQDRIEAAALSIGIAPALCPLCEFLVTESFPYRAHNSIHEVTTNFCGILEVARFEPHSPLNPHNFSEDVWQAFSQTTGYLQTCHRVLAYSISSTVENYELLLQSVNGQVSNIFLVSEDVLSWLPPNILSQSNNEHIRFGLSQYLTDLLPGHPIIVTISHAQGDELRDWARLSSVLPILAARLLLGDVIHGKFSDDVQPFEQIRRHLMDAFAKNVNRLRDFAPHWGKLLQVYSDEAEQLRDLIIRGSDANPSQSTFFGAEPFPFTFRTIGEEGLLPHIVNCICEQFIHVRLGRHAGLRDGGTPVSPEKLAGHFVSDSEALLVIRDNKVLSASIRGAACLMYILHVNANFESRENCVLQLPLFCDSYNSTWFLRACAVTLRIDVADRSLPAMTTMSKLFEICRTNFAAKISAQPIIDIWRETARAPVNNSSEPEIWSYSSS